MESNFLSIPVEFFSITFFLFMYRGELFKILTFWGMAGARFLFALNFTIKYLKVYIPKTRQHFETPPARCGSETGFGILNEFWSRKDLYIFSKTFQNIFLLAGSVEAIVHVLVVHVRCRGNLV